MVAASLLVRFASGRQSTAYKWMEVNVACFESDQEKLLPGYPL